MDSNNEKIKAFKISEPRNVSQESSSPHQESSHEKSIRKRYQVEKNSQNEDEIVIPYWEDSSSAVHHLQQQIRLLKMKNFHFQEHMERMSLEYNELKNTIEVLDENEKQHIRRNSELILRLNANSRKNNELKNQAQILRLENEELKSDLSAAKIREEDYRRKISKLKEQQTVLSSRLADAEEEQALLKSKNDEQKRKRLEGSLFSLQNESEQNKIKISSLHKQIERLKKQLEDECEEGEKKKKQLQALKLQNDRLVELREESKTREGNKYKLEKCSAYSIKVRAQPPIEESNKQQLLSSQNAKLHDQLRKAGQTIKMLEAEVKEHELAIKQMQMKQQIKVVESQYHPKQREQVAQPRAECVQKKQKMSQTDEPGRADPSQNKSTAELENQYNNELQALRRLILYKRYHEPCEQREAPRDEDRIRLLLRDYQELQRELNLLEQEVMLKYEYDRREQITFRDQQQRALYIQSIRKWQIAYEQLYAVYEARLISKDEQIKLLNLKIVNLLGY